LIAITREPLENCGPDRKRGAEGGVDDDGPAAQIRAGSDQLLHVAIVQARREPRHADAGMRRAR
jgi:hypothetical protein